MKSSFQIEPTQYSHNEKTTKKISSYKNYKFVLKRNEQDIIMINNDNNEKKYEKVFTHQNTQYIEWKHYIIEK